MPIQIPDLLKWSLLTVRQPAREHLAHAAQPLSSAANHLHWRAGGERVGTRPRRTVRLARPPGALPSSAISVVPILPQLWETLCPQRPYACADDNYVCFMCICAFCRYTSRRSPGYAALVCQCTKTLYTKLSSVSMLIVPLHAPSCGSFTVGLLLSRSLTISCTCLTASVSPSRCAARCTAPRRRAAPLSVLVSDQHLKVGNSLLRSPAGCVVDSCGRHQVARLVHVALGMGRPGGRRRRTAAPAACGTLLSGKRRCGVVAAPALHTADSDVEIHVKPASSV